MLTLLYVRAISAVQSEKGATAVEYGVMVALIAVAIITTVGILGTRLDGLFVLVKDKIPTAVP